jgi:hypothetical protein
MVLSEILSTSFLFSIAIVIILVGGLFAYFNHRFSAQNHKISSMMGLVSTMAEEMQYFRSKLSGREQESCCKMPDADLIHIVPQFMGGSKEDLIEVSDEEDDSDEEEDDSDEEEEDSDEEEEDSDKEDDDSDEEDDSDSDEEEHEEEDNVKSICIDLGNEIDINIGDEIEDEIGQEDSINISNTKTINLSEDISSFEITSKTLENINDIDIDISINLTDVNAEKDKVDYKKMSINKLREIIVEKGLVVDASKLKKNDVLKMLGAEQ